MENKLPIILFIFGIACIIIDFLRGEARAGVFVIFPFIFSTGFLSLIGILFIFLSIILSVFSFKENIIRENYKEKKGGIIFFGPIPIIFSKDFDLIWILIIISIFFFIMLLLAYFLTIAK